MTLPRTPETRPLRLALENCDMTKQDLAEKAGVSLQTIHNAMRRNVNIRFETATRIARALNVPTDYLNLRSSLDAPQDTEPQGV